MLRQVSLWIGVVSVLLWDTCRGSKVKDVTLYCEIILPLPSSRICRLI